MNIVGVKRKKGPASTQGGFTLIDVLLAIGILLVAFVGIFGALQASVQLVSLSKAKSGAIALANEQLEILRSLSYDDVGTIAGIPSGNIAQNATTSINGVEYGIRTFVQYVDAPQDGLGVADTNTITADYKVAKVEITWNVRGNAQSYALISNIVPRGIETLAGGGTLTVNVIDAVGGPVENADVRILNNTTTTTIDVTSSSNTSGVVTFPGAPAASEYEIYVSKTGYSSSQTHEANATNPNPNPGHVSVTVGDTTTITFAIDLVSTKTINTFEPIATTTFSDTFTTGANLSSTTNNMQVIGGELILIDPGTGYSLATATAESIAITSATLAEWDEFRFSYSEPASTTVLFYLYHDNGGSDPVIIPDPALPGNSAGFNASPVDISGVSTTTYDEIFIHVEFLTEDASTTPRIFDWELDYTEGPVPLPNIPFTLQGTKTIGSDAGGPLYKVLANMTTDGNGTVATTTLEWDTYTITINDTATGYDIADICEPQPRAILPNTNVATNIVLVPDTPHTLLVTVRNNTGGYVEDASVRLSRSGYDVTQQTSNCGQTLFTSVPEGTVAGGDAYDVEVSATGFTTDNQTDVEVSAISNHNATLFP